MEFQRAKFENVKILFERRELPLVTIMIAVPFGSGYESEKEKGIAHFVEHMLFKGTSKRNAKQIATAIEKVGGEMNGHTAEEITFYYAKLPSKHLDRGINVLADMLLNPKFKPEEIKKERGVIFSEIARQHDSPISYVIDKLKEQLYKKPFGLSALGTKDTLNKIGKKELCMWHSYYSNFLLVVVGKTDMETLQQLAKTLTRKRKAIIPKPQINKRFGEAVEKRAGIDQSHIALGFHVPTLLEKQRYAIEIANCILGIGMSSKLFTEIREKKALAYTIFSFLDQEKSYGNLYIYGGIQKDKAREAKELILKEIKKLQQIKSREVEQAKEQLIGYYNINNEKSDVAALNLLYNEIAMGAEEYYAYPERIAAVKLKEIKKITKFKNYSSFILLPK